MRRLAGWAGLIVCAGLALAVLGSAGKPLHAQAISEVPCKPPSCQPTPPIHSPRPPRSPTPTATPTPPPQATQPGETEAPSPTPVPTDAAPLSPDGTGVAAGVLGVESTPHGLLTVPHDSTAAVAQPSGDTTLVFIVVAILGVVALSAVTLAVAVR
jgi:hypothetical protein